MKKQFLPYELALKLKELGFDEKCLAYWDDNFEFELNDEFLRGSQMDRSWVTAPLWQQSFEWIRNKYNIDAKITSWTQKGNVVWYYSIGKIGAPGRYHPSECSANTYHQAILKCLTKIISMYEPKETRRACS